MRSGRTRSCGDLRRALRWGAVALALAAGCDRGASAPPHEPAAEAPVATPAEGDGSEPVAAAPAPAPAASDSTYSGEAEAPVLPPDLPLYTAAQPISSMSSPTRGTIVNLHSADDADRVSAWYGQELPARGWRVETQSGATTSHLVTAVKEGRKATVLVTGGADGSQILLTVVQSR